MKLENCHGLNLLNHLNQMNISFQMEQYPYLSSKDLEDQKDNIVEEAVSTLKNPDYNTVIKFKDQTYEVSYVHKNQDRYRKRNLWRTKFTFNDKVFYSLESTKKKSLRDVVNVAEKDIKTHLL